MWLLLYLYICTFYTWENVAHMHDKTLPVHSDQNQQKQYFYYWPPKNSNSDIIIEFFYSILHNPYNGHSILNYI